MYRDCEEDIKKDGILGRISYEEGYLIVENDSCTGILCGSISNAKFDPSIYFASHICKDNLCNCSPDGMHDDDVNCNQTTKKWINFNTFLCTTFLIIKTKSSLL